MKRTRPLLAALAVAAVALSGCARARPQGPDTTAAPSADPVFCRGISDFRAMTADLTAANLKAHPEVIGRELTVAHDQLVALVDKTSDATFKADLRTVADNWDAFARTLAKANGDPQGMTDAAINYKVAPQVTKATSDLDTYAHTFCGLNTEVPPTTVGGAPVGPALPAATATTR